MAEVAGGGITEDQVRAIVAPVSQKADAAMSAASAGLTSADRQQVKRIQVTPDTNGRVTFTFPSPYAAGSKIVAQVTAETPSGVTYRNDASIEEGSATNTQVVILVQRIPRTLTASVLGAVLTVLAPVTTPVWLNIFVRAEA